MLFKIKNKYRPLYKQFLKLRENMQTRSKVVRFQKKKWQNFITAYEKRLKNYNKFKPKDQNQCWVSRKPQHWCAYKSRHKNTLISLKKLKLFYGGLPSKTIKKLIKTVINQKYKKINSLFLEFLESRLDTVLYRAKFSRSIRSARQLIIHNKILVNNRCIRIKSYLLKTGDLITVDPKHSSSIKMNNWYSETWPNPPKYLTINYKTLQIIFGTFKNTNLSLHFFYHLKLEKILTSYYKH